MSNGNILLVWGDNRDRRALYKALATTGAGVSFANDPSQLRAGLEQCRLVVMDYDAVRDTAREVLQHLSLQPSPPPVLVVTSSNHKADLIELFGHAALTNLVAKNADFNLNELIITAQKVIRNDIFGLDKYLSWGVQAYQYNITSSAGRFGPMKDLESYLHAIGANRRLAALAHSVADELLMNAIYNAPADPQGNPKYASRSRTEQVELLPDETVSFSFACDGQYLGLCVADRFGRLETDTVRNYLRKCFLQGENQIDTKDGGAGLGLYYIFQSLNHFIINVARGKRTELIGLMDISGSFKDFAQRTKSLHLFIAGGRQQ
ncbi:MAG: hypothetical protein ACAI38_03275 [Myxococcota bacterium]|nr:hypothetical protein [Myxococcota bacterium]